MEKKLEVFKKNPKKALFSLAWPIIVANIIQTLYNIVDTAYVGRLGAEALAALTFSFPLFFVLIAINGGVNSGMTSRIARYMGANDKKGAENAAIHGLLLSIFFTVFIIAIVPFLEPLFILFGATGNAVQMAVDYMSIVSLGSIFLFMSFIFSGIFSGQGDTKTPMKIQITAAIFNVILDPILIFGFGMGIKGAALATISAFFLAMLLSIYYIRKKSYLHIHVKNFKYSNKMIWDIVRVGFPASLVMLLLSIYVVFINRVMAYFSTEHVAAFGITSRLEGVAIMPIVGIAIASLTLVGMFYGAKRYDLVKEVTWFGIKSGVIVVSVLGAIFALFPEGFFRIFTDSKTLIDLATPYLRIDTLTFPLMVIGMMSSRVMQGLGKGFPGLVINIVRVFLVAIPLAFFFVFYLGWGYLSAAWAMVFGGIAGSIVGLTWLMIEFKTLLKKL